MNAVTEHASLELVDDAKPAAQLPAVQQTAQVPVLQQMAGHSLTKGEAFMLTLVDRGMNFDQIERAMDLKRRMDLMADEQAFHAALAAFKAEGVVVTKDRDNKQFGSKYSSLGNLVDTATPYLSKHGLSASFDQDQADGLMIMCTLSLGLFSKTSKIKLPLDTSGQKNAIQQIKSSITYGRVVTFEAACGISSSDPAADDDGNGFTQATMQDAWVKKAQEAKTLEELDAIYAGGTKAFQAAKDTVGYAAFAAAGKKRSKAMQEKQHA